MIRTGVLILAVSIGMASPSHRAFADDRARAVVARLSEALAAAPDPRRSRFLTFAVDHIVDGRFAARRIHLADKSRRRHRMDTHTRGHVVLFGDGLLPLSATENGQQMADAAAELAFAEARGHITRDRFYLDLPWALQDGETELVFLGSEPCGTGNCVALSARITGTGDRNVVVLLDPKSNLIARTRWNGEIFDWIYARANPSPIEPIRLVGRNGDERRYRVIHTGDSLANESLFTRPDLRLRARR